MRSLPSRCGDCKQLGLFALKRSLVIYKLIFIEVIYLLLLLSPIFCYVPTASMERVPHEMTAD